MCTIFNRDIFCQETLWKFQNRIGEMIFPTTVHHHQCSDRFFLLCNIQPAFRQAKEASKTDGGQWWELFFGIYELWKGFSTSSALNVKPKMKWNVNARVTSFLLKRRMICQTGWNYLHQTVLIGFVWLAVVFSLKICCFLCVFCVHSFNEWI